MYPEELAYDLQQHVSKKLTVLPVATHRPQGLSTSQLRCALLQLLHAFATCVFVLRPARPWSGEAGPTLGPAVGSGSGTLLALEADPLRYKTLSLEDEEYVRGT